MKKLMLTMLGIMVLSPLSIRAAQLETPSAQKKFYGQIMAIDANQNAMTVSNKRKKLEEKFKWNNETKIVFNKKEVSASILKIGQNLIIYYTDDNGFNNVHRLTVRKPYERSKTKA